MSDDRRVTEIKRRFDKVAFSKSALPDEDVAYLLGEVERLRGALAAAETELARVRNHAAKGYDHAKAAIDAQDAEVVALRGALTGLDKIAETRAALDAVADKRALTPEDVAEYTFRFVAFDEAVRDAIAAAAGVYGKGTDTGAETELPVPYSVQDAEDDGDMG